MDELATTSPETDPRTALEFILECARDALDGGIELSVALDWIVEEAQRAREFDPLRRSGRQVHR